MSVTSSANYQGSKTWAHKVVPQYGRAPGPFAACVREAPMRKMQGLFGHCPNGGGVSTLAQMVWGTYFEKNIPCSKGHLLGLRGSEPLPGWFGALMQ